MFFSVLRHNATSSMAPAATSCHACGKSGCKLLRCSRCRNVWFCNRECQVVAARQGHSGANCCSADKVPTPAAEVAPRLPAAAGPSTTAPGVIPASLASAANSCHACGKSEGKLLRCGQCKNVWFCNRECQVVAARQGHSGVNCCPADKAPTPATEVALCLPAAAGPSTTVPGVIPASLAAAATSCHACGKSAGRLLLCGRCRNAWLCNRECQVVARQELGHTGASCRPAAKVQHISHAAPSQPPTPTDATKLLLCHCDLIDEAHQAQLTNTRIALLAAAAKYREAASVADLIGGADGASLRANADQLLSSCMTRLGNMAAAVLAALSSLRAARASSDIVSGLIACGKVATIAPDEMANAERASREQERISGYPVSYGGLDLSHEGQISLPTTPAALSRLGLAYNEAAVGICDAAIAAAGGRGSLAANDNRSVPDVFTEAQARSSLGLCLQVLGEERQRSLELLRQAVGLRRQELRTAVSGQNTLSAQRMLADQLSILGVVTKDVAEAEACLREALALGENTGDVQLKVNTLRCLIKLGGVVGAAVGPAEAEGLSSRVISFLCRWAESPRRAARSASSLSPRQPTAQQKMRLAAMAAARPTRACVC